MVGQGELKNGAARLIRASPYLPAVPFDDVTADGQAYAHAMELGSVESLE